MRNILVKLLFLSLGAAQSATAAGRDNSCLFALDHPRKSFVGTIESVNSSSSDGLGKFYQINFDRHICMLNVDGKKGVVAGLGFRGDFDKVVGHRAVVTGVVDVSDDPMFKGRVSVKDLGR